MSPTALLWSFRLKQAAHWLRETDGTVGEVAYASGFKSVPHFTRRFRDVRSNAGGVPATGARSVGGRMLHARESRGQRIRCVARLPEALRSKCLASAEVVVSDVVDRASLDAALYGVDSACYHVHSMGYDRSFEDADRKAALKLRTPRAR